MANLSKVRRKPLYLNLPINGEDTKVELRFDMNAMADMEDRYGNIDDALKLLEKGRIRTVRDMLWAGIHYQYPDMTPEQLGSMIDMADMMEMSEKLNQALNQDLPEESDMVVDTTAQAAIQVTADPNA